MLVALPKHFLWGAQELQCWVAGSKVVPDLLCDLLVGGELGVESGDLTFGLREVLTGGADDGDGVDHDEEDGR